MNNRRERIREMESWSAGGCSRGVVLLRVLGRIGLQNILTFSKNKNNAHIKKDFSPERILNSI